MFYLNIWFDGLNKYLTQSFSIYIIITLYSKGKHLHWHIPCLPKGPRGGARRSRATTRERIPHWKGTGDNHLDAHQYQSNQPNFEREIILFLSAFTLCCLRPLSLHCSLPPFPLVKRASSTVFFQ